jgi:predicted 3-demethylubiquinone-9 3-methyltransferase (glyoxalase superfamily)
MQKIAPFLWFNAKAEEAARFYTSVFKGPKKLAITRYGRGMPGKPGSVMTVKFRILGQEFTAINAGPEYKFSPAVSFVVYCRTQREIDYYWKKLTAGGREVQCGWLADKYGLSWQIVPDKIMEMIGSNDPARSQRVMDAVMGMVKLDLKVLRRAAAKK